MMYVRCSPANPVSVSLILISFLALSACTENSEKFKDKQTCKVSQTLFFVFLRSNCCFFTLLQARRADPGDDFRANELQGWRDHHAK